MDPNGVEVELDYRSFDGWPSPFKGTLPAGFDGQQHRMISSIEGEWPEKRSSTGTGIIKYASGDKYEGGLYRLKYSGQGAYTLANGGGSFTGEFLENNIVSGTGTIRMKIQIS